MYKRLRKTRDVERAFQAGRYVYFRAKYGTVIGRWVRVGNKGRGFFAGLLRFGEVRIRA